MDNDPIFPRRTFSPEDIHRVLRAAAPIPESPFEQKDLETDEIRTMSRAQAIEERLSAISARVIIDIDQKSGAVSASHLAKRLHAVAAAAETLLKSFGS